MNKKLVKLLLIISAIFIGIFTNIKGVNAEANEFYSCKYKSPLSFMDSSGRATKLQFKVKYGHGYRNKGGLGGILYDSTDYQWNTANLPVQSLCLVDDNGLKLGFELTEPLSDNSGRTNISQRIHRIKMDAISVPNSQYVKITYNNGYKATTATAEEYKTYLSKQYSVQADEHYNLYDLIFVTSLVSDKKDGAFLKNDGWELNGSDETVVGIKWFKDDSDTFKNWIMSSGGVVFINETSAPTYPHTNLDLFKKMMKEAKTVENVKLTDTQQQNALNGLGTIVDISDTDKKVRSKEFFDATRKSWYTYMKDDLKNPKKAEAQRKEIFNYWFKLVSRYSFESDANMKEFLEYFEYIYQTGTIGNINSEQYENIKAIIDYMVNYKDASTTLDELESNNCLALCDGCIKTSKNYNSSACSACQSGSDYKKCYSCTTTNCKSVPGTAKDSCLKGCMGDKLYETYSNAYSEAKKEAEDAKQDSADGAYENAASLYALTMASMPELNIKFEKYEVQCEDVTIFHNIYIIIIILAPAITIVLGTVDYFRAVLAGDEKKMQEQKKKMPKRIIMLVCLILVPILIRIILGLFTSLDNSLMDCVVNGK